MNRTLILRNKANYIFGPSAAAATESLSHSLTLNARVRACDRHCGASFCCVAIGRAKFSFFGHSRAFFEGGIFY